MNSYYTSGRCGESGASGKSLPNQISLPHNNREHDGRKEEFPLSHFPSAMISVYVKSVQSE